MERERRSPFPNVFTATFGLCNYVKRRLVLATSRGNRCEVWPLWCLNRSEQGAVWGLGTSPCAGALVERQARALLLAPVKPYDPGRLWSTLVVWTSLRRWRSPCPSLRDPCAKKATSLPHTARSLPRPVRPLLAPAPLFSQAAGFGPYAHTRSREYLRCSPDLRSVPTISLTHCKTKT